jgi:protocatechuate 3,4-dioxygenase beta subunit
MTDNLKHEHDLARDLDVIDLQLRQRRRLLRLIGSSGLVTLLPACGGGDSGSASTSSSTGTSNTSTSTSTPVATNGSGTTTTSSSNGSCIADPVETAGPFPADGTNTASGATSDILTSSGIVRSDIRSSFLATPNVAAGVKLTLTIQLVNVNNACAPLAGYSIYLWHCDANGNYSLYTAPSESYLRGVQVTDTNGQVTFTTIFPACYAGRYPHIHFEIYSSLSRATSGQNALLISQFALPAAQCSAVYADASTYPSSASRFSQVSLSSDNVFSDNTSAQIAQQTPAFGGSPTTGYTASVLVGASV